MNVPWRKPAPDPEPLLHDVVTVTDHTTQRHWCLTCQSFGYGHRFPTETCPGRPA